MPVSTKRPQVTGKDMQCGVRVLALHATITVSGHASPLFPVPHAQSLPLQDEINEIGSMKCCWKIRNYVRNAGFGLGWRLRWSAHQFSCTHANRTSSSTLPRWEVGPAPLLAAADISLIYELIYELLKHIKGQSCSTKTAASPWHSATTWYLRELLVSVQYW